MPSTVIFIRERYVLSRFKGQIGIIRKILAMTASLVIQEFSIIEVTV
jgi:hypothetical protein